MTPHGAMYSKNNGVINRLELYNKLTYFSNTERAKGGFSSYQAYENY